MTDRLEAMYEALEGFRQPRSTAVQVVRPGEPPPRTRIPLATLRAQFPERSDDEIAAALEATNDDEMTCRLEGEYVVVEVAK